MLKFMPEMRTGGMGYVYMMMGSSRKMMHGHSQQIGDENFMGCNFTFLKFYPVISPRDVPRTQQKCVW